jgi:arylsulfatase A-like enzyme/photosystem II stability/assembly factor-like uncharacterized protein
MPVVGAETLDLRDIEAFDERQAVALAAGEGDRSRIFKTTDGGQTWQLCYVNSDRRGFLDAIAFWDAQRGLALGDPVDGRFVVLYTADGGVTWTRNDEVSLPPAAEGEGAFAASGTCLVLHGQGHAWFGTGAGRVFRTTDSGLHWTAHETPIRSGGGTAGIFSLAFFDESLGVAVGGDYKDLSNSDRVIALTNDGGVTWRSPRGPTPRGYRSAVGVVPGGDGRSLVVVGPSGGETSTDGGETWRPIGDEGFHAIAFGRSTTGLAVGDDGRIARFRQVGDQAAVRPNIILIVADDLGWTDVGALPSDFYETPNLDRIAREGMVFTASYAAAGNCIPSRACLLSGHYTPRHHVYAVWDSGRGPKSQQRLIPIRSRSGLAPDVVTMADALKSAGYATAHFGKWHLAGPDGALPRQQGFDESTDATGGVPPAEGPSSTTADAMADPKGVFTLTEQVNAFVKAHRDQPFFCYLAHHAVHTPLQARPSSLAHFQRKPPGIYHRSPPYAACLFDLDASIGLLLKNLEELELADRTLVIFTSDNGAIGDSSQEPLRGNKGCYYEGGIRVPMLACWPGVIEPGRRCDVPVSHVDLFPTYLEIAGAAAPTGLELDGESLCPLLRGEDRLRRSSIFWHFPGYLDVPVIRGRERDVRAGFRTCPVSVIRRGDWKLHLFHEEWQLDGGRQQLATNQAVELYNLASDPGERTNIANANAATRDALLDDLMAWLKATEAPIPDQPNPEWDPLRRLPNATATSQGANE